ncbi:hypothetical protein DUZ99_06865 [Xylanibacillus composti]|nr:hypothetical protein [Xylanibacillus composti]
MIQHRRWHDGFDGSIFWNLIYIVLGLYFLGRNLDLLHFGFGDLIMYAIPAVLILVGLQMIFRPSSHKHSGSKHWDKEEWKRQQQEWKMQWKQQKHEWKQQRHDWKKQHAANQDEVGMQQDWVNEDSDIDLERLRQEPDFLKDDHLSSMPGDKQEASMPLEEDAKARPKKEKCQDTAKKHGSQWYNPDARNFGGFIGDLHLGEDVWELQDMNISHFIGDTVLDLTKAEVPYGETKLTISAFIGDIKVFVPHDMELEVMVVSSSFLGDKTILDRHEGGLFKHSTYRLSDYDYSEKRIRIVASQFIGDLLVQRVG